MWNNEKSVVELKYNDSVKIWYLTQKWKFWHGKILLSEIYFLMRCILCVLYDKYEEGVLLPLETERRLRFVSKFDKKLTLTVRVMLGSVDGESGRESPTSQLFEHGATHEAKGSCSVLTYWTRVQRFGPQGLTMLWTNSMIFWRSTR